MKKTVLLTAAVAALSLAACQKKDAAPEAAAPQAAADAGNTASAAAPEAAAVASPAEDAAAGPIDAPAAAAAAPAATAAGVPASATAPNESGTESTEAFITGVTLSDLYQVQAGKIAETKGQSQGVKDFGTMMVADHTAMSNQLKHLFAAAVPGVQLGA